MILDRKKWLQAFVLLTLLVTAGCSGINTSGSVSPATFLLPGLMRHDPRPEPTPAPLPPVEARATLARTH